MSHVEPLVGDPIVDTLVANSAWKHFVRVQPWGVVFPAEIDEHLERIMDFEVAEDDVWVASFPKCGTTWTLQMVWSILSLDSSVAGSHTGHIPSEAQVDQAFPYFELTGICTKELQAVLPNSFTLCDEVTSRPRLFKTHLMYDMLPAQVSSVKPRIIYVTRNPRDTCLSLYHYMKALQVYSGSFEDYFDAFLNDTMPYYTPMLQNVQSYWDRREMENVLFITYEDMKEDLGSVVRQVAAFLGKQPTAAEVAALCDELSFSKMKESEGGAAAVQEKLTKVIADTVQLGDQHTGPGFMRKGQVGGWASVLTEDQVQRFMSWEAKWLKNSDLKFRYNI